MSFKYNAKSKKTGEITREEEGSGRGRLGEGRESRVIG